MMTSTGLCQVAPRIKAAARPLFVGTRPSRHPTSCGRQDFTDLKVIGPGAGSICRPVLDDFSRYIVAWKLCTTMRADDVMDTLTLALEASGCDRAEVVHKPRLLSDNGSSYIAGELADWFEEQGMDHVRGAPYRPQTQGKIERWHQTLKNRILLENYYLPKGDLKARVIVGAFGSSTTTTAATAKALADSRRSLRQAAYPQSNRGSSNSYTTSWDIDRGRQGRVASWRAVSP